MELSDYFRRWHGGRGQDYDGQGWYAMVWPPQRKVKDGSQEDRILQKL